MSRIKLKLAIVAAACILNAGLAVASGIWLYRRNNVNPNQEQHLPDSSNVGVDFDAEFQDNEIDTDNNGLPSQSPSSDPNRRSFNAEIESNSNGLSLSSRLSLLSPSNSPTSRFELNADDSRAELQDESGGSTGTNSVSSRSSSRTPAIDDHWSGRNNSHTGVVMGSPEPSFLRCSLRSDDSNQNSVDGIDTQDPVVINNQPASISTEFSFVGNDWHMIQMSLVSNATARERRISMTVLQFLQQTGDSAFTVFANYNSTDFAWTSDNLFLFLQGLVTLWSHDCHGRCQKLSVNLPTDELPPTPELLISPTALTPLLPQQLKTVAWKGHHDQFGLFFSPELPCSIRTLVLRCKLSLNDCERLLYWGRGSLRRFDVHYIARDVEDALSGRISELRPNMDYLESISIVANWDIFRLFEYFNYPRLRELHIANSKPMFETTPSEIRRYFANVIRNELTSTRLHCAMTSEERDWLDEFRGANDVGYHIDHKIANINFDLPGLPNTL